MTTTLRLIFAIKITATALWDAFWAYHGETVEEWLYDDEAESPVLDTLMIAVSAFVVVVITARFAVMR